MLNKYAKRGLILLVAGVVLNMIGLFVKTDEVEVGGYQLKYGWMMILGVLLFGAGFLYILYSFIRKVEHKSILEERAEKRKTFRSKVWRKKHT